MAHVSILWGKSAAHHLNYISKERNERDVTSTGDCIAETAVQEFKNVRELYGNERGNQCLHIEQSFSHQDSAKKTPEELNEVGRKLAEVMFPGHQFVVRTHTDKAHFHNHIIVNTVNMDTGRKIENKKLLLRQLRSKSDELCSDVGLSVISKRGMELAPKLPHRVQQMVRHGKSSYIFDLVQKADFARKYARSYDEYTAILGEFGIRVAVENKNISYLYPGKERAKRGAKLGHFYDKKGLEASFAENGKTVSDKAALLYELRPKIAAIKERGGVELAPGVSAFSRNGAGQQTEPHSYSAYTKSDRSNRKPRYFSDRALEDSLLPLDEIRKARRGSIFDYCLDNGIPLTTTKDGRRTIKGKEFVTLAEHEFTNTKNGSSGSLIDFVAIHRKVGFLHAVSIINDNPRLLLLEKHMGEVKRTYDSFYFPKESRAGFILETARVSRCLSAHGVDGTLAIDLHSHGLAQSDKTGLVRLFGGESDSGAMELREDDHKQWHKTMRGTIRSPFFQTNRGKSKAVVFFDPFTFLKMRPEELDERTSHHHDTLVLFEPSQSHLDQFVAARGSIEKLFFVPSRIGAATHVELDFFNNLKARYAKLDLDVHLVSSKRELSQALERGRERSAGLEL